MAYYITKNPGYVAGRREEVRRKKEKVLPRRDVGDVGSPERTEGHREKFQSVLDF